MPKEKVNYQEVYDLYQLCSETKDLKEFCSEYQIKVRRERRSKTIVSKETYDKRRLLPCYIKI